MRFECGGSRALASRVAQPITATMLANRISRSVLTLWLALVGCSLSAQEQAPVSPDPHERLLATLASPEVEQQMAGVMLRQVREQFAANPQLAAIEQECPGALDVMTAAMRTAVTDNAQTTAYQADFLAILRQEMPADQAAEAATFFTSGLGQRVLLGFSSSMSFDNAISETRKNENGEVSRDAYDRDREAITRNAVEKLSAADAQKASRIMATSAWGKTMARLQPQLRALQHAQFNHVRTPEEDAALRKLYLDALGRHVDECLQD